ncbi:MAG: hypothetical protein U9O94_08245 [Nanoarchaeota archaeon]|nr:hypothetical protein [Nanoarchaeota archaeon]
MKQKLSITLEGDIIPKMDEKIKNGTFRNKSHLSEFAIRKLLEDD